MQLSVLIFLLGATAAVAKPFHPQGRGDGGDGGGGSGGDYPSDGGSGGGGDDAGSTSYVACTPGALYANAQCCATDVGGVADLDCENPSGIPASPEDFAAACAAAGKTARCCVIPVLGQDVLCTNPQGL
ncbi:putative Hydrophobin [Seiridium cardinale]